MRDCVDVFDYLSKTHSERLPLTPAAPTPKRLDPALFHDALIANSIVLDEDLWSDSFNRDLLRVLNTLHEREKFVIIRSFGVLGYDAKTLSQIGKELNRTSQRVSQIKRKALRKLRVERRKRVLKQYL
jgi:RNA polymerase primary sigma factor